MSLHYINSNISIIVGSSSAVADLTFDVVDGSVYRIREADLVINQSGDSANAYFTYWLSVLKDGRTSYAPFSEGFAGDIIGHRIVPDSEILYGAVPVQSAERGYLADDPFFESIVRFGGSGAVNVAGAAVSARIRLVAERVKATAEIRQQMYNRSYS